MPMTPEERTALAQAMPSAPAGRTMRPDDRIIALTYDETGTLGILAWAVLDDGAVRSFVVVSPAADGRPGEVDDWVLGLCHLQGWGGFVVATTVRWWADAAGGVVEERRRGLRRLIDATGQAIPTVIERVRRGDSVRDAALGTLAENWMEFAIAAVEIAVDGGAWVWRRVGPWASAGIEDVRQRADELADRTGRLEAPDPQAIAESLEAIRILQALAVDVRKTVRSYRTTGVVLALMGAAGWVVSRLVDSRRRR